MIFKICTFLALQKRSKDNDLGLRNVDSNRSLETVGTGNQEMVLLMLMAPESSYTFPQGQGQYI